MRGGARLAPPSAHWRRDAVLARARGCGQAPAIKTGVQPLVSLPCVFPPGVPFFLPDRAALLTGLQVIGGTSGCLPLALFAGKGVAMARDAPENVLELTVEVVAAYVSNNPIAATEIPAL